MGMESSLPIWVIKPTDTHIGVIFRDFTSFKNTGRDVCLTADGVCVIGEGGPVTRGYHFAGITCQALCHCAAGVGEWATVGLEGGR